VVDSNCERPLRVFRRRLRRRQSGESLLVHVNYQDFEAFSDLYYVGIFSRECNLCGHRYLPFSKYPMKIFGADISDAEGLIGS
jgi:hypothetical protein